MATTIERPARVESSRTPGRRGLVAVLAVVVVAGFVVWAVTSGGDDEKTSIDIVQELAAAMRDDDVDTVNAFLEPDSQFREVLVWSMALRAEPTLSDCTLHGPTGARAVCDLTFGSDYFYSQVLGETLTTRFGVGVGDGRVWMSDFDVPVGDTPDGIRLAEAEFRSWAESNRPDLDDQIFVQFAEIPDAGHAFLAFPPDHASGELRMELLDDFMASRQ